LESNENESFEYVESATITELEKARELIEWAHTVYEDQEDEEYSSVSVNIAHWEEETLYISDQVQAVNSTNLLQSLYFSDYSDG